MKNTVSSANSSVNRSRGASIAVKGLGRQYGQFPALRDVGFELPAGRVMALLGPSGCGKSTLLKLLAGLDQPSSGEIHLDGRLVASASVMEPAQKRRLGMVFQDYALWPHMSVFGNVAFPLQMQGVGKAQIKGRVHEVLESVGLAHLAQRAPSALSGGQQQRVALARAIVARPALLLFDEPLSNLDRDLREGLATEIARLLRSLGTTAIYVTHDHEEACTVADEVAVMFGGRIAQIASPQDLWSAPASAQVAQFLKLGALLPAVRQADGIQLPGCDVVLDVPKERLGADFASGPHGQILVPDSAVRLQEQGQAPLRAEVTAQQYRSGGYSTTLQLPAGQQLRTFTRERFAEQSVVGLDIDVRQLRWFAVPAAAESVAPPAAAQAH